MIYFIEAIGTGRVKIGYASNVARRLATLQVGCPYQLQLLRAVTGGKAKERALHELFRAHRTEQGEWFHLEEEITQYIRKEWQEHIAEWFDGFPLLRGRTTSTHDGIGGHCTLLVVCPLCATEMLHGFRPGPDWLVPSHRLPHCECGELAKGYYIKPSEDMDVHYYDPRTPLFSIKGNYRGFPDQRTIPVVAY